MRYKSSQSNDWDCYSIMSSAFSDKVGKAASSLQRIKDEALQKEIQGATLKLAHTQETRDVVESWFNVRISCLSRSAVADKFQNKEQLKALEPLAKIPSQIQNSWPILYPNKQRAGQSEGFGPSTYIVLIALADLNKENGLPTWQGGPQRMGKGEWTHFSGDKAHYFDKQGGGLAIVIRLDKAVGGQ